MIPYTSSILRGCKWQEVATDRLLHVDRGPRYARFLYGAQRIGFRHLESQGSGTPRSNAPSVPRSCWPTSDLSFFVERVPGAKKGDQDQERHRPRNSRSPDQCRLSGRGRPRMRKMRGGDEASWPKSITYLGNTWGIFLYMFK